jgi:hypothetical protein
VNIPLTYEDMMEVGYVWDESKLVFQKVNMQGADSFFLGSMLREQQPVVFEDMNKGANQALAMTT